MTLTPHTDAAKQSAAAVRALYDRRASQDPVQRIRERASVEVNAAILIALGEMMDIHSDPGQIAFVTSDVLAAALASVALTLAKGNEPMALDCLDLLHENTKRLARSHVRTAPERGIVGTSVSAPMAGEA